MSEAMRRHGRRSRRARVAASLATVSAAAVLVASGSAASAHQSARASASLLPTTVHPPTFNDSKLFGIRNALHNALKGQSLKSVNTWMVVNILATYWVAGKDGNAAAAKELGIPAHFEGPSQGQLSTQVSMYNTLAASGANGMFTSVIDPVSEGSIDQQGREQGRQRRCDRLAGSGQGREDVRLRRYAERDGRRGRRRRDEEGAARMAAMSQS